MRLYREDRVFLAVAVFALWAGSGSADLDSDTENVHLCYEDLVHYEGLGFPLYGKDEKELDETCKAINVTIECLEDFIHQYLDNPDCDEECGKLVNILTSVIKNSGLNELHDELCFSNKLLRLTYLDNYECLEKNGDSYATCHNHSQLSQEYMKEGIDHNERDAATCCFFSWYQDCFINATEDHCGSNATFWVSYSLHILMGRRAENRCGPRTTCGKPPLPPDDHDWDIVEKPVTEIIENSLDDKSATSVPVSSSAGTLMTSMASLVRILFYVVLSVSVLSE